MKKFIRETGKQREKRKTLRVSRIQPGDIPQCTGNPRKVSRNQKKEREVVSVKNNKTELKKIKKEDERVQT